MNVDELIKKSIFNINNNGMFTQYLIPSKISPLKEKNICGCWLLDFNSKKLMNSWLSIYETLQNVVNANIELKEVVCFENIYRLNEHALCQNRGFNEAYTTENYAEFLTDGDCKPNEEIEQCFNNLKKALNHSYDFRFESENQKIIIEGLIEKAFIEPNFELKWTEEPFPWTLYIPPISAEDIKNWE